MDDDEAHDPLATTFPRVTQCSFKKFGASGTIETRESLCILPQNILNEKVFILMWFWFVLLATITAMHVSCVKVIMIAMMIIIIRVIMMMIIALRMILSMISNRNTLFGK